MDINVKSQVIFFPLLIFIIFKLRWSFCWCPCCNGTWLDIVISSLFVVAERHRFYFEGNESQFLVCIILFAVSLPLCEYLESICTQVDNKKYIGEQSNYKELFNALLAKRFLVATSGPVFLPVEKFFFAWIHKSKVWVTISKF